MRPLWGAAYAIEAGMLSSTSVPAPASLQNSNRAPIRFARSRIPNKR